MTMEDWTNFGYHFSGELILLFLVLGHESSVNVISCFNIGVKREILEWHFTLFIVILSEKLVSFIVISRDITKIT